MATPATQIIESLRAWLTRADGGFDFSQYARPIIENLRKSGPSIAVFAEQGGRVEADIAGNLTVDFRFRIEYKDNAEQENDLLRISQCLNALSDYFDEQTRAGLPDLNLGENITPYEITTVATATQSFRGADNNAVFSASFNLNYMEVQNGF